MAVCGMYTGALCRYRRLPVNPYDPHHVSTHQSPDGLRRQAPLSILHFAYGTNGFASRRRMVNPEGEPSWRSVGCTRLRFEGAAGGRLINAIQIMRRFTNRPTDCGDKRRYPSSMLRTAQIRFSWRMVNPKGKPSWRSVGCTRLRFAGAAGGRLINTIRIMRRFTNRPTDCGAKRRYPSSVLRTARTGSRPDGGWLTRRVNRHGGLLGVHGCALQISQVAD